MAATRPAVPDDAPELVRLRETMFRTMGHTGDEPGWRECCEARLRTGLAAGTIIGIAIDAPDSPGLASCVVAELADRLPTAHDALARQAYLSNVSTDPRWRRQGFARAVVTRLVEDLHAFGVSRIDLHATPEGTPLYESLGFGPRPGEPELRWMGPPTGATTAPRA